MTEWYSPGQIAFTEEQTLWLLENFDTLRNGAWPAEAGSYVDPSISKPSPSSHAPFESAVQVSAELQRRLEDCGYDGAITLLYYAYDHSTEALARYFRLPEDVVKHRAKVVLRRISRRNYRVGRYRRWNVSRGRKL